MDKFVHRKESTTPCILDRSHGLNEIAGFQVKNLRCQMRYKFGQVVNRLDRSILVMIAGLFLSLSAFSQTPGGPAGPYPTSEQTIQFPAEQDKTPVDSQMRLKMDQMLAAQVFHPSNIEDPRPAYFLNSKFAGPPESVFRVEDRKVPGPGGSIPVRLSTPNARTGLPPWVFFTDGGFVAGRLDTYDVPLRAVTNRCNCPVVSAGYRLALNNRYPAAPEHNYAATKWVTKSAPEIDQNPKNPLSATPPGTFGLPPTPGSPQTPTSEAFRAGGNIDLTTLAAHFRVGQRIRRLN
jgi:alpha/beta hydrolase family protein